MKANDFIKKHGILGAKRALLIADNCSVGNPEFINELEKLVASHVHIDRLGGLINAKKILKDTIRLENMIVKGKTVIEGISSSERIKFHIDKVERCQ